MGLGFGIENVGLRVIDQLILSASSWNESDGRSDKDFLEGQR